MKENKYIKGNFFIVPNRDTLNTLPATAQTLFMWLCARADNNGVCFPSLSRLCKDTNTSKPTLLKNIDVLIEKKFIKKHPGNATTSNHYQILLHEVVKNKTMGVVKNKTMGGKKENHGVVKNDTTNNNHITITNNNTAETSSASLIVEIIKMFADINPACKRMYSNKTQRQACQDLLDSHSFEDIKKVIQIIPKTNGYKYCPTITTPLQLRDKWVALESELKRIKSKKVEVI